MVLKHPPHTFNMVGRALSSINIQLPHIHKKRIPLNMRNQVGNYIVPTTYLSLVSMHSDLSSRKCFSIELLIWSTTIGAFKNNNLFRASHICHTIITNLANPLGVPYPIIHDQWSWLLHLVLSSHIISTLE